MKSTLISICLAAVAAGLIVFWNLRTDSISSSTPGITATHRPATLSEGDDLTTEVIDEWVDSESDRLERSAAEEAIHSRLDKRQQDMAEAIYQLGGTRVVQRLSDSGLALSDSEEIARTYAADVAECAMASLKVEAARQSIPVTELLSHLEAAARDGGDPFDVVECSSLEANAAPCGADAMQRAGIPLQSDVQISDEEITQLRECIDDYSNSDIVDRNTILEICTEDVFGAIP